MELKDILNDELLSKDLEGASVKIFGEYKLFKIMTFEEFKQEVYLFCLKRTKNYDEEKGRIRPFIFTMVATCGKIMLKNATGQSKKKNKLDFHDSMLRLDKSYTDSEEDKFSDTVASSENIEENSLPALIVHEILNMDSLSKREKEVLELMLNEHNLTEISRILNISRQFASSLFNNAKKKILRKYGELAYI